jgi:hypothetical protein
MAICMALLGCGNLDTLCRQQSNPNRRADILKESTLAAQQAECAADLPTPVNQRKLGGSAPTAAVGQASRPSLLLLLLLLLLLNVGGPLICRQRRDSNSSRGCNILQQPDITASSSKLSAG